MMERRKGEDTMKELQLGLREFCDWQGHLCVAFEFQFHERSSQSFALWASVSPPVRWGR